MVFGKNHGGLGLALGLGFDLFILKRPTVNYF
jgi:hypothetical protein